MLDIGQPATIRRVEEAESFIPTEVLEECSVELNRDYYSHAVEGVYSEAGPDGRLRWYMQEANAEKPRRITKSGGMVLKAYLAGQEEGASFADFMDQNEPIKDELLPEGFNPAKIDVFTVDMKKPNRNRSFRLETEVEGVKLTERIPAKLGSLALAFTKGVEKAKRDSPLYGLGPAPRNGDIHDIQTTDGEAALAAVRSVDPSWPNKDADSDATQERYPTEPLYTGKSDDERIWPGVDRRVTPQAGLGVFEIDSTKAQDGPQDGEFYDIETHGPRKGLFNELRGTEQVSADATEESLEDPEEATRSSCIAEMPVVPVTELHVMGDRVQNGSETSSVNYMFLELVSGDIAKLTGAFRTPGAAELFRDEIVSAYAKVDLPPSIPIQNLLSQIDQRVSDLHSALGVKNPEGTYRNVSTTDLREHPGAIFMQPETIEHQFGYGQGIRLTKASLASYLKYAIDPRRSSRVIRENRQAYAELESSLREVREIVMDDLYSKEFSATITPFSPDLIEETSDAVDSLFDDKTEHEMHREVKAVPYLTVRQQKWAERRDTAARFSGARFAASVPRLLINRATRAKRGTL